VRRGGWPHRNGRTDNARQSRRRPLPPLAACLGARIGKARKVELAGRQRPSCAFGCGEFAVGIDLKLEGAKEGGPSSARVDLRVLLAGEGKPPDAAAKGREAVAQGGCSNGVAAFWRAAQPGDSVSLPMPRAARIRSRATG